MNEGRQAKGFLEEPKNQDTDAFLEEFLDDDEEIALRQAKPLAAANDESLGEHQLPSQSLSHAVYEGPDDLPLLDSEDEDYFVTDEASTALQEDEILFSPNDEAADEEEADEETEAQEEEQWDSEGSWSFEASESSDESEEQEEKEETTSSDEDGWNFEDTLDEEEPEEAREEPAEGEASNEEFSFGDSEEEDEEWEFEPESLAEPLEEQVITTPEADEEEWVFEDEEPSDEEAFSEEGWGFEDEDTDEAAGAEDQDVGEDEEDLYESSDEPSIAASTPLVLELNDDEEDEELSDWSWDEEEAPQDAPSEDDEEELSFLDEDQYDPAVQQARAERRNQKAQEADEAAEAADEGYSDDETFSFADDEEDDGDTWEWEDEDVDEAHSAPAASAAADWTSDTLDAEEDTFEDLSEEEPFAEENEEEEYEEDEEAAETVSDKPEAASKKKAKKKKSKKSGGLAAKIAELKAAAAAELQGKDYKGPAVADEDDENDEEGPLPEESEEETPKKKRLGASSLKVPGPLNKVLNIIFWPYKKLSGLFLLILNFVFGILGKIPGLGKLFAKAGASAVLGIIASLAPLALIVLGVAWANGNAVPEEASVSLPDEGGAAISQMNYDSKTNRITATVANTGNVIAEVTPTYTVYTSKLSNPWSFVKPKPEVQCTGKLVKLNIEEAVPVTASCTQKPTGFFPHVAAELK